MLCFIIVSTDSILTIKLYSMIVILIYCRLWRNNPLILTWLKCLSFSMQVITIPFHFVAYSIRYFYIDEEKSPVKWTNHKDCQHYHTLFILNIHLSASRLFIYLILIFIFSLVLVLHNFCNIIIFKSNYFLSE